MHNGFVVTKYISVADTIIRVFATTEAEGQRGSEGWLRWAWDPAVIEFRTSDAAADFIRRREIEGAEVRPLDDF